MTEGLLDHDASPLVAVPFGESAVLEVLDHDREESRRDREVERVVAHGAAALVDLVDDPAQLPVRCGIGDVSLHEPNSFGELGPDLLTEGCARVLAHGVVHLLGKILVIPLAAGEAHEPEARGE
jgi:hypothetical protein